MITAKLPKLNKINILAKLLLIFNLFVNIRSLQALHPDNSSPEVFINKLKKEMMLITLKKRKNLSE